MSKNNILGGDKMEMSRDVTTNVTHIEAGQIPDKGRTEEVRIHGQREVDPDRVTGWWQERAQRYQAPPVWTIGHVDYRLVQGFEVLLRLPMRTMPKEFGTAMPAYRYEWEDLLAQASGDADMQRAGKRLRYRHKGATADEVAAMEQALAWPMSYLQRDADASRAVLLGSMWKATETDIDRKLGKLGIGRRAFFYRRKRGLESVVAGLVKNRVVVT